ncbi:Gp49 family protein [Aeromonas allosaccharophila]|uniref:Gp49 family protein n=1 Tax=Aeromonas allosaccharophila TaxID=656 RepID=UPI0005A9CF31|nr:Gp49 family protein [Aeromonas allosaccharophila]
MSDQQIEQEIQAKGLTAPRVTMQHIDSVIDECHYFTAGDAARIPWPDLTAADPIHPNLDLLTICVLVLKNGFTVTGESACASPENFSAELGRKIARENAINKVWMLEGYLLKQQLHDAQNAVALTDADALADLNGTPRPDNPSVAS